METWAVLLGPDSQDMTLGVSRFLRGCPAAQGARLRLASQPARPLLDFFFFNRKTNTCVTWGQVESLSLYYIYFLQLGFPVYRLVLGSSKRAKEEIGIAELRAAQRPSVQER